ncbi:hypothetical protein [Catalinimonas alkaloidigena]|uniref:hypothetical protein n=1 Tax=Catalinimonas alkaloidigena TaxID=1075417 RepID=UPI002406CB5F|nr:hypothetical protein [Catalinimonas alkaloidigena]
MKATPFALLIPLLLMFACEGEQAVPSNTLGSEIELSMTEYIDADQRSLSFKFLTLKDFPCINYRIKHDMVVDQQAIKIVLEEVEVSDVCLDAIGPASAFVDLGMLDEKEYDLQIQMGSSLINHGTLSVSKDAYELNLLESEGIELAVPKLNRIPAQAVWGTIKYTDEERHKKVAAYFEEAMDIAGATDKKFSEGDYGYFKVSSEGKITQPIEGNEAVKEQAFLFDFAGKTEDLLQVLQRINSRYNDVQLRFYNAQGEEFRNWNLN